VRIGEDPERSKELTKARLEATEVEATVASLLVKASRVATRAVAIVGSPGMWTVSLFELSVTLPRTHFLGTSRATIPTFGPGR
jgi:hypothetical protein